MAIILIMFIFLSFSSQFFTLNCFTNTLIFSNICSTFEDVFKNNIWHQAQSTSFFFMCFMQNCQQSLQLMPSRAASERSRNRRASWLWQKPISSNRINLLPLLSQAAAWHTDWDVQQTVIDLPKANKQKIITQVGHGQCQSANRIWVLTKSLARRETRSEAKKCYSTWQTMSSGHEGNKSKRETKVSLSLATVTGESKYVPR